ncbi:hypothetical protein BDQ17DRAFT_910466 [Cyathus striatus]|nr:hypothetical protein BDQ17DRAFT_910466 [Cyathus striatus]
MKMLSVVPSPATDTTHSLPPVPPFYLYHRLSVILMPCPHHQHHHTVSHHLSTTTSPSTTTASPSHTYSHYPFATMSSSRTTLPPRLLPPPYDLVPSPAVLYHRHLVLPHHHHLRLFYAMRSPSPLTTKTAFTTTSTNVPAVVWSTTTDNTTNEDDLSMDIVPHADTCSSLKEYDYSSGRTYRYSYRLPNTSRFLNPAFTA